VSTDAGKIGFTPAVRGVGKTIAIAVYSWLQANGLNGVCIPKWNTSRRHKPGHLGTFPSTFVQRSISFCLKKYIYIYFVTGPPHHYMDHISGVYTNLATVFHLTGASGLNANYLLRKSAMMAIFVTHKRNSNNNNKRLLPSV